MQAKRKPDSQNHTQTKTTRQIKGSPFKKKCIPVGDRFRKNAVALFRPDLRYPSELLDESPDNYAERGINILNSLYSWRPPGHKFQIKKPILWTFVTSISVVFIVLCVNAAGSRYVGDLPAAHRIRPLFCQFLAAQAFFGFDTGQYAIIARCTQISPINVSV